ncbi:inositol polyphosphate-4-phosphatase type I A [Trichonephila inaurata madagascariensis]|uniref:phosphatidylinositol-3,4-bisphosphate 4-phosphatase n=1 Tax=Trichonephila inaurata madagascariensis TaxID=2747483 RepID=A0A8X6YI98_9ARAC|nr:inositol polyphosphate-4-phosphatase type I A [Trichonephila inaurata madagascariensis]
MRFNSKEIVAVATQPSYKFDKEGILFVKEKHDSLFRRNDVFLQRWCRLRGNLLFYYKTKDQYSEPAGLFVLEEYYVRLEESAEVPYSFSLVFKQDEVSQQLGALTESERDSWIQALHMASFEYMQSQLSTLKAKLKEIKAINDNDSGVVSSKRQRSFTASSSYDPQQYEPFMELSICCDNLMCDGDGQPPNPLVCVSINTLPSVKWTRFAQTEIVEKSSNPCFFTTVTFVKGEVTELTRIKLSVYDVKERVTCTSTLLGESVFTLENLLQSHHRTLRLTLVSPSCASVGFISISAREMSNTKQRNAWLLLAEEESLWSKVERPRSYSLPSRLTSQVGIPVLGLLKTLSNNFVTQTYRFHTGLGAELHVHEIMAESKLSVTIPCMLLDLWINEEKKLMETVFELNQLPLEWQQKYLAATDGHLRLINHYTEVVDFLLKQKGSSFKPSIKKKDTNFEFVPVNLHVQRMWVQNVTTRKTGVYDIITVGAFSAYSRRFRQGGLLRLLNQLKSYYPLFSGDNGSAILGPDPISRSAEAIMRIEQLQEEIESDLKKIISLCDQKYKPTVQAVLNSLSSKGDQLTRVCAPHLVEEILSVWDSLRPSAAAGTMHNVSGSDCKIDCTEIQRNSSHSPSKTSTQLSSPVLLHEKTSQKSDVPVKSVLHEVDPNASKVVNEDSCIRDVKPSCSDSSSEISLNPVTCLDEIEPLDLTHLNIKASIMCMASKVQSFISGNKEDSSEESVVSREKFTNWTDELMPSIKKLRQAIQCLMKTAKLTYSIVSLKESTKCLPLSQKVRHRRDIVFSQALTSLVTGLMTRLWCRSPDSMFIHMLRTVGVLCHFEGLLSCYGDEMGALEDMVVAIDDLRRVLFWLEPSTATCSPQPRIEGSRLFLRVFIPAPPSVINLLPADCHNGYRFTVSSVFFNIGINEQATLAEKFGDTSLQDKINQDSLSLLKEHFSRFQRTAKAQKGHGFHFAESHIADLLEQLHSQIYAKKSKNVDIIHLSSEICKYLGGIRFTSCKSAKDRTSMSVTLEQAIVLIKDFNLDDKEMPRVLECMRSEGTRRENTLKNTGVRKYHFNSLQLMTLPRLYRPPPGTYGNVVS